MNRTKALFIADRIMTRIETDKAIHKDAIADEIQAAEVIDVISYDEAKGQWVHRDGTPLDLNADQVPAEPEDGDLVETPDGLKIRIGGKWVLAGPTVQAYWDSTKTCNRLNTEPGNGGTL